MSQARVEAVVHRLLGPEPAARLAVDPPQKPRRRVEDAAHHGHPFVSGNHMLARRAETPLKRR